MIKNFFLFLVILLGTAQSFSQNTGSIKGVIIDRKSREPIAYANISLFNRQDSLLTGTISNEKGKFYLKNIPSGKYRLHIGFMGYQEVVYKNFIINGGVRDLGKIPMQIAPQSLKEVHIRSGKPPVTYKVDRKVINASAFPQANVALDLLENVPSLKIDVSGKITYRNDAVFQVFINGKPVADGADRLRQIPANRIDRIEIITNPSAKYAAEGTAGIINVVLKKNRLKGYRITAGLAYQTDGTYSLQFSIGRNTKRSEWHLDAGIADYKFLTGYEQYIDLRSPDIRQILDTKGKWDNANGRNYISFGYNYDLTSKDEIDISFHIDPFYKTEDHDDYGIIHEQKFDASGMLVFDETYRYAKRDHMTYQYVGPSLRFTHKFDKAGDKKLELSADYFTYLSNFDEAKTYEKQFDDHIEKYGTLYNEQNEKDWEFDLDFTYPFNDYFGLEAGSSESLNYIPKTTVKNGYFTANDQLTAFTGDYHYQEVNFERNIYASYISLDYGWKKWKFKTGIRYEFVDRRADFSYNFTDDPQLLTKKVNSLQYGNWFPTLHLQYSFDKTHQVTASYTRRISRPRYFLIMPVKEYESPFSYITGDENIQPTSIDSWELNYQKSWDKDYFSVQYFLHQKNNLMTYYNRIDPSDMRYLQYTNAGNSLNSGLEIGGNYHIYSWWNANLSVSVYRSFMHLYIPNEIDRKSDKTMGNIQLNQDFDLPARFKIQLKLRYDSPWEYLQREGDAVWKMQVSLQKRLGKHWRFLVYTNNLWGDIVHQSQTLAPGIRIQNTFRYKQYIGFKLMYNFNNRK